MDHNKDYTMINGFAYYRITSLIQRIFLSIQRRKTKQYKRGKGEDNRQITLESYSVEFLGVS